MTEPVLNCGPDRWLTVVHAVTMRVFAATAVMIALGLTVSACSQRGVPYGGASSTAGQFSGPDRAGSARIYGPQFYSPATNPDGSATFGRYGQ